MARARLQERWSRFRPQAPFKEMRPSTILAMAVAGALVLTSGGVLVARLTGLWAGPKAPAQTVASSVPVAVSTATESSPATPSLAAAVTWRSQTPAPGTVSTPSAVPSRTPTAKPTPSPTPTPAASSPSATATDTITPAAAALSCAGRAGYDLSVCGQGEQIAAEGSNSLPCSTSSGEAHCGDSGTGYAVVGTASGGSLRVRYFPAYVACLPSSADAIDRFDCLRLSGHGESSVRLDNAFLEVWTDGTTITGRTVPRNCSVSSSFTCSGVAVALSSSAISVEYAASSAVTCAGFPDQASGQVLVRCGYR